VRLVKGKIPLRLLDGSPVELACRVIADLAEGVENPRPRWTVDTDYHLTTDQMMQKVTKDYVGKVIVSDPKAGGLFVYDKKKGYWVLQLQSDIAKWILRYNGRSYGKEKRGKDGPTFAVTQITGGRQHNILEFIDTIAGVDGFFEEAEPSFHIGKNTGMPSYAEVWAVPEARLRCRHGRAWTLPGKLAPLDYTRFHDDHCDDLLAMIRKVIAHADADEEEVDQTLALLLEFIGMSLIGAASKWGRGICLKGTFEGGNGKSVILDMIAAMFDPKLSLSVTGSIPLRMDFDRALLAGKRLLTVSELESISDIKATNGLVTGNKMNGRILGSTNRMGFEFSPVLGVIWDCNDFPKVNPTTLGGLMRRWAIIECSNTMTGDMTEAEIKDLIWRQTPALSCAALEAAALVYTRRKLTPLTERMRAGMDSWIKDSDAIAQWVPAALEEETGAIQVVGRAYEEYVLWCDQNGNTEVDSREFSKRVLRYTSRAVYSYKGTGGVRCWKNIRIKAKSLEEQG